jgi:predicted metal-dependent phosphotriesterase family hydrolase
MHVQTVTGPTPPETLGITLPFEHVYIQQWHLFGKEALWQLEDDDVLADEIAAFKKIGGTCLVDATPACIGRKPERLKAMSERTGVPIVMATGWYIEAYAPPEDNLERRSVQSLADEMIREITVGVGTTGIRAGLIGEFGATASWISPLEERIHRASARASLATGVPLSVHAIHSEVGLLQLDLFEEEGVDPGRIAIGHCDSWPMIDYWRAIAERGAFVQIDNVGHQLFHHEDRLAALIKQLVDEGHTDRILLSHDMGLAPELRYFGGRGLTYLFETFLPVLRGAGVPESAITQMITENPKRLLSIEGSQ